MLRIVGVPARMVVGFAQGEFQAPDKYIVRDNDAHAWPEVYFPGLGWVEFEPTVSQPPLDRAAGGGTPTEQPFDLTPLAPGGNPARTPIPAEGNGNGSVFGGASNSLVRVMVIFIVFVLLVIGGFLAYTYGIFDRVFVSGRQVLKRPLPILVMNTYETLALPPPAWLRRWAYFAGLSPIERSFGVVYQGLRWLNAPATPARTPAEAADSLAERLPEVSTTIHSLLQDYQQTLFSQKHGDFHAARRAMIVIRRAAFQGAVHLRVTTFRDGVRRVFSRKTE
jgi:hypothetical protein